MRFAFGDNWQSFLRRFTPERLEAARQSLLTTLGRDNLKGLSFLDAGSGSGLFSAAAHSLGARVVAFDYDPASVSATSSFGDPSQVLQGSLLDAEFMGQLGTFDVVYCWGVAHHTGDMWRALELLAPRVASGGSLCVAIYNDQGKPSQRWTWVKHTYHRAPALRPLLIAGSWVRLWAVKVAADTLRGDPLRRWRTNNHDIRGMDAKHDLLDWVGGYPFEVAKPEEIFEFFRQRGFSLERLSTTPGIGCNEFVFRKA